MLVRYYPGAGVFVTVCVAVAVCVPMSCGAAEWSAEPSVRVRREYYDNYNQTVEQHHSVSGYMIGPKLVLGSRAEAWQINGSAELSHWRYPGDSSLDRDDNTFNLVSQYATERDIWRLEGTSVRDSVFTYDRASADTGTVQVPTLRETHGISPSWTRMLTETMQLQLAYQLNDVSYVNGQSVGLYDYRYGVTTARLTSQLSEQNQVIVIGGYSAFHVPSTGFDSINRNIQIGASRTFSESMQGTLLAGARRTESLTQGGKIIYRRELDPYEFIVFGRIAYILVPVGVTTDTRSEKTGSTFNGSLEKKFERSQVNLTLARSLDPSGSGGQIEQDSIEFRWRRQMTSGFQFSLNVNTQNSRIVEGNISNNDRKYYYVEPSVYWQLSPEWTLSGAYRHTNLKRDYES